MAVKQAGGRNAPDGSMYVTNTDGAGNLGSTVSQTRPASGVQGNISAATSATALLSSDATRLGATIYNDSSASLYILLGAGTVNTTNTFTCILPPNSYYEVPASFTGVITGIWTAATGSAKVGVFN